MNETITLWRSDSQKMEELAGHSEPENVFDYFLQRFQMQPATIHLTDGSKLEAIITQGNAKGLITVKRTETSSILYIKGSVILAIGVR